MENTEVGIILEGGAMRSVFSAGVLDCFLDSDIRIPNIIAVSAGAYTGMNYVSGQKGRIMQSVVYPLKEYKYMGMKPFLKKGTFFDMDFLFDEVQRKRAPYDFGRLKEFAGRFMLSTVDMLTGEVLYFDDFEDEDEYFKVLRAANSLPLIAKISDIGGRPLMDGGVADAIPVTKALEEGWKKLIVVLTKDASYRKKPSGFWYNKLLAWVYRKYPAFVKAALERHNPYNEALDTIAQMEQAGRAFVFRPTDVVVGNSECNVQKLEEYYRHGYDMASERLDELKAFLADEN
ncbi:MAG: patatin family protein [Lachnospiraceae bacterium]|nr:patatin family protein [Lachnospiraceae bacterium]